jgi:hypothetical protein
MTVVPDTLRVGKFTEFQSVRMMQALRRFLLFTRLTNDSSDTYHQLKRDPRFQ